MSIRSRLLSTVLLAIVLLGLGAVCVADIKFNDPFNILFEPVGTLEKGVPVTMQLEYTIHLDYYHMGSDTGSYSVILLNPRDYKDTLSITNYPVNYDEAFSHSATIDIDLQDSDTIYCVIKITCGRIYQRVYRHFITSGNEVQFLQYYTMPSSLEYQRQQARISHEVDRDTLTQEDLQKEYLVVLDLRDPKDKEFVERIIGSLPDSCIFDQKRGYYLITTSLKHVHQFMDQGIKGEGVRPQSRDPRLKRNQENHPDDKSESDPSDLQGLLPNKYLPTAVDGYSLDSVGGETAEGLLPTGTPITDNVG